MKLKAKVIIAAIVLGMLVCTKPILEYGTMDHVTFTVQDKAPVVKKGEDSYYLVFTDKGVFKNSDDIWFLKWDSSDLQGKLKRGNMYTCSKNFWRIQLLSKYENLLYCDEVE